VTSPGRGVGKDGLEDVGHFGCALDLEEGVLSAVVLPVL